MSGHSQFKNIMHRKGAQDARRAKAFTKLIRELTTAARAGLPDPDANPRLRAAMIAARAANMPKDTIERAIKRGTGEGDGTQYEEMRYEGFGPGGVAIIVEALTDNRHRTVSDIRAAFGRYGGHLGETNSVSFMFERQGAIRYPAAVATSEQVFDAAIDVGADDVVSDPDGHEIVCASEAFSAVRDALEARLGPPQQARLTWRPRSTVPVDGDAAASLLKLLDILEDNDDVQTVSANFEISDELMARLTA